MARPNSKIMSVADKKAALVNIKTAIKQHDALTKTIGADTKLASLALAAAKKSADAMTATAAKLAAAEAKKAAALVATAQKAYAAAVAAADKKTAAATKGSDKLAAQLAALDATPTDAPVKAVKAPKVKAAAQEAALV